MANFDFQGKSDLSEKQINFICEVLEKHGFKGSKVTIEALGKAGDNYGSNVKSIVAEQEDGKTLKMVAKIAPTTEFFRKTLNVEIVFRNESLMYDKILPKFRQLEKDADVPEEDRLKFPICYGTINEKLHELVLLEDLRESNYCMNDKLKSLTDKDVRVILNAFAKLHSFSFVLKRKDYATYKKFTSELTDYFTSPILEENVNNNFKFLEDHVHSLFDDKKYKDKILGSLTNIAKEARKLSNCDAGSTHSVIIHGDSWNNNILLKRDSNGIADECMLIDYQLSAERSPVSDFLYLIFSSTDYETRSKNYDSWIDEYHEKLDKYLSYYGIKVNYAYPKEKMLADLKRYSRFFLGWSITIANVLCMDTEDAAKFKDAMNTTNNPEEILEAMKTEEVDNKTQNLLKIRVQGIIDSYFELGYCT